MKRKLYIAHPNIDFAEIDSTSKLITNDNVFDSKNQNCHTTLGDLHSSVLIQIFKDFDEIVFINELFDPETDLYKETVCLLTYLSNFISVKNFSPEKIQVFTELDVRTRPDTPVIWVYGCSHSYGVGLEDRSQTYGAIMGNMYNMPVMHITKPGTSARWSLRHLINSDIRSDDIVVWQVTTPGRVSLSEDRSINEYLLKDVKNKFLVLGLTNEQLMFDHLSIVNYGMQYLRSLNVKFVMATLLDRHIYFYEYMHEFVKYREYCYVPDINLDFGNDNLHYGPNTHAHLANRLTQHLELCYN